MPATPKAGINKNPNINIGFNKINGDSSQGDYYRLNAMEDFSAFRTQLTYNF